MGCQPSRLVFTGLLFEASHPGAGGTLLLLRPNKDPNPALPACQLTQVLPCTLKSACRRSTTDGGMNSSRNQTTLAVEC